MSETQDYAAMKVPELKKLLQARSLTTTGNKADLVARLQGDDKKNESVQRAGAKTVDDDEINYKGATSVKKTTESDKTATTPPPATKEIAPATKSITPAAEPTTTGATTASEAAPAAADTSANASDPVGLQTQPATEGDAANGTNSNHTSAKSAQNLAPTSPMSEAEKRAARAARFGISFDADSEEAKLAERAKRFGVTKDSVANLDSALSEQRPSKKRGRVAQDDGAVDKDGDNKRPTQTQNQNGNRNNKRVRGWGQNSNHHNSRRDENSKSARTNGYEQKRSGIAADPAERAKMEARARRFES